MNFVLSEEHLRDQARYREFAEIELRPYVRQMEEEEAAPPQVLRRLKECGLLGIPLEKNWGGAGKDFLSATLCMEELSKVSPAVAGILNVTTDVVSIALRTFGTDEQKEKYLKPLASGEKIGAFALTEPGAGSDAGGVKTAAVEDGGCYVLNGTKMFITNAGIADIFLIAALTDIGEGKKKISLFIVEKGMPGFRVGTHEKKMGIRASSTCELILEDVKVPKANLLGTLGKGLKIALGGLDGGRVMIAAQALGIAQGCIDCAVAYLKEHTEETGFRIKSQTAQFKLADLQTRTDAARLLTYRAANLWDQGLPFGKEAAMAKLFASETANEVARDCVQLMGYAGCSSEYPVEGLLRDAKITEIYEGTNEIQRQVIAGQMGLKV